MLIKFKSSDHIGENQVTDESVYHNRRDMLKKMGFVGTGALMAAATPSQAASLSLFGGDQAQGAVNPNLKALDFSAEKSAQALGQVQTPELKATTHNNFYEFGTQKNQPSELAQNFKVNPWQLKISGHVENELTLDYDDLFNKFALQERIYRLRCVEAWSMVIPWIGFPLAELIKLAKPTSDAKYVAFKTLYDPEQMPGQASRRIGGGIKYPYIEGLRLDEAMNDLTLMSVGMYGKALPNQNGAPVRLVVPWKYGFKSIKSIVSIELTKRRPKTTWNILAPNEYGFYANVNPDVSHPRWSQASERRITTGGLFARNRIETLPFNGYGEQVAHLYKGMNLRKNY